MSNAFDISEALKKVAASLHQRIATCADLPNLEVEMRILKFAVPCKSTNPTILPRGATKGKLAVGISERHFDRVVAHLSRTLTDEAHPAIEQTTEDIQLAGTRYTYLFPQPLAGDVAPEEAAAPTLLQTVHKNRQFVEDVKLPCSAYDLRLSVNVENPLTDDKKALSQLPQKSLPTPPPPSKGPVARGGGAYKRRKERTSFQDGTYQYDCTRVVDSRGQRSFEVEVEGKFADAKEALTLLWVEGLLGRMTALVERCADKREREIEGEEGDTDEDTRQDKKDLRREGSFCVDPVNRTK